MSVLIQAYVAYQEYLVQEHNAGLGTVMKEILVLRGKR